MKNNNTGRITTTRREKKIHHKEYDKYISGVAEHWQNIRLFLFKKQEFNDEKFVI